MSSQKSRFAAKSMVPLSPNNPQSKNMTKKDLEIFDLLGVDAPSI